MESGKVSTPSKSVRRWFAKAGSLLASVGIALLLCEAGARLFRPAPPEAREPGIRCTGDAELGYVTVPNQQGWLEEGFATINSLGLRGPEPLIPKPAKVFRILVTGDSCTFGWGVNDDETFPAQLAEILHRALPHKEIEVVNGAVPGYDAFQEAGLLRRLVPVLQPDLLLVGFFYNDLPFGVMPPDGDRASPSGTNVMFSLQQGESRVFMSSPPGLPGLLRRSRLIYCLRDAVRKIQNNTGQVHNTVLWEMALLEGQQSKAIDAAWSLVEKRYQDIKATAAQQQIPAGIVIIPTREQVRMDYPHAQLQNRMIEIGRRCGFFIVDPLPKFVGHRSEVDSLFIPYDRLHTRPSGQCLVAEATADVLLASPELLEMRPARSALQPADRH